MMMTKLKFLAAMLMTLTLIGTGSALVAFGPKPAEPEVLQDQSSQKSVTKREEPSQKPAAKPTRKERESGTQVRVKEEVKQTFKTEGTPRLVVEMFNGGIDVVAKPERTVEVHVTKRGSGNTEEIANEQLKNVEVTMAQEGETIRVQARKKEEKREEHGGAGASAELQVPAGAILELRTGNGPVTATGVTGEKNIHTSNGAIRVKGNTGSVHLVTKNGPISVDGGKGPIELDTKNGAIEVRCQDAMVTAHTSNGSVHFRGTLAPGKHSFRTSNGKIAIALPPDAKFHVDARTTHGAIQSDFFTVKRSRGHGPVQTQADVGDKPDVSISLETSNGTIEIRKGDHPG
jgi:hypothetical protein